VIFTTNHCPDAIASHGRMVALVNHFKGKPVKFVAINSNSPEGLHLPELGWTVYDDSFEDMKLIAKDSGFQFTLSLRRRNPGSGQGLWGGGNTSRFHFR
jgi:hypothetical protein